MIIYRFAYFNYLEILKFRIAQVEKIRTLVKKKNLDTALTGALKDRTAQTGARGQGFFFNFK